MMSICRRSFFNVFISCSGSRWMPTQQPLTKILVALKQGDTPQWTYYSHPFNGPTTVTPSMDLLQSPLQWTYYSHPFNGPTTVTPSMDLLQSPLQWTYYSHPFNGPTTVTHSMDLLQSPLQSTYYSHPFNGPTTVTPSMDLLQSPLQIPPSCGNPKYYSKQYSKGSYPH